MIQPIVEGHGEIASFPVLLRRLVAASGALQVEINRPIRRSRWDLVNEERLRKSVRLALLHQECHGVLILFDGDDDAPCELGPRIQRWAEAEAGQIPCAVVIAQREYEAWFLGALESLRGRRGIRPDAASLPSPETVRGAKERLETYMQGQAYSATTDQPALSDLFDMAAAFRSCRSFRRLVRAFGLVALSSSDDLRDLWPPPWARRE